MPAEKPRKKPGKDFFVLNVKPAASTQAAQIAPAPQPKPAVAGLRVNLGFAEIAYQGKGHFLYFYKIQKG